MDVGISILVTFVLIVVNGFFSGSEMALVSAKRVVLQKEAEEGSRRAQKALTLSEDPDRFLAAIQVAITLVGFFASATAATNLSAPLSSWLSSFGIDWLTAASQVAAPILITLIVSYASIVFGELVPKRLALADAEKMAGAVAGPLTAFSTIASPLVRLTAASSDVVARAMGIKSAADRQDVSEEEIRYIVADNDELDDEEKRMIHEVLDLGDTTAEEAMTPRVDMVVIEAADTVLHAIELMRKTGYSRLPVFSGDHDNVVGMVRYKDLIGPLLEDRENDPVSSCLAPISYVPESKDLMPLLNEMQTNRQQRVMVVDEYGGTAGLITIEDIVEEIVGDIIDETDLENRHIIQTAPNEWLADGAFTCDDAADLGWPVEVSDAYETIAGWLMDTFDRVPQVGNELVFEGYVFRVQQMRRRRIAKVLVRRLEESASEPEAGDGATREAHEA